MAIDVLLSFDYDVVLYSMSLRLAVNAKVATALGSITASYDTVESDGRQMKHCSITYIKRKNPRKSPLQICVPSH
jgi:hypothetical protein